MRESKKSKRVSWASNVNLSQHSNCYGNEFFDERTRQGIRKATLFHVGTKRTLVTDSLLIHTRLRRDKSFNLDSLAVFGDSAFAINSQEGDFKLHRDVRLFLSDESPAQVGVGTQDHLQAKSSWVSQPTGAGFDDNLPPGFEASRQIDLLKNKLSQIPLSKWTRPPRFVLDSTWQVVAGEESKEVEIQNQREMRILEAVYPRPSAIPPNPSALTDLEPSPGNEFSIPLIPITPIEDEDTTIIDTSTNITPEISTSAISQPAPSTTANANTPFSVVNTIDPNLLMKILNDPKWHERLMANQGAVTNPDPVPNLSPPSVLSLEPSHVRTTRPEIGAPTSMASPLNGTFYRPPIAKDLSYYKSLVQQHGGEKSKGVSYSNDRQYANQEVVNNVSKKTKACVYFNSPRGCRNGDSCPFQHGLFAVDSAKRVKLDRDIIGE